MKRENIVVLIEAVTSIKAVLEDELTAITGEPTEMPTEKKAAKSKKSSPTKAKNEEPEEIEGNVTKETLDEMTYNDLKAFAKEIGVKAVGNRNKITELILEALADGVTVPAEAEEDVEEEKPIKKSAKKVTKKQPEPVEDEPEDELADIKAQLEDMDIEELADICKEAGISARGKKPALITKILNGIEDGIIELDMDYEEDEDAEETSEEAEEYTLNDPENPEMTEERAEAIVKLEKSLRADIKRKKITVKQMTEELVESCGLTKKEVKELENSGELADFYTDFRAMFIDDEGNEVGNEEPYELNGIPACCGKLLDTNEDGEFVCNVCGNVYEAE